MFQNCGGTIDSKFLPMRPSCRFSADFGSFSLSLQALARYRGTTRLLHSGNNMFRPAPVLLAAWKQFPSLSVGQIG
jgi:hypothetical protein